MAAGSRISKRSTVAFAGLALLALAFAAGTLHPRPVVQLIAEAIHGVSTSSETWVPALVLRGSPMINRMPHIAGPAESRKSPPIEFQGAQNYVERDSVWSLARTAGARLGVPSQSRIVAQTGAGVHYVAIAASHRLFASPNSITVGIADSSLTGLKSFNSYATPNAPSTL